MNKNKKTWQQHYPPHAQGTFKPTAHPVHLLLEDTAAQTPNAPALTFMGQTQTYTQLMRTVTHLAHGLQNLGVRKGDRIALVLPNIPYYVAAYYAALKVGATVVNTNPLYTQTELQHIFKDSAPKLIFALNIASIAPKVVAAVAEAAPKSQVILCSLSEALPPLKRTLYTLFKQRDIYRNKNLKNFNQLLENSRTPKTKVINTSDVALLQYTGGTTGLPKGAMLTHANITAQTTQVSTWLGESETPHTYMATIPFFHVFAMTACLNLPISTGAHIVMLPRFEMKPLLKALQKYKITLFPAVPTLFKAINHYPKIQNFNLSSLQFCISGGAPLPARTKQNFETLTGATLVEGYGLTEASPVLACNPPHKKGPENSIGLPLPGTILSIRNPENTAQEMVHGEIGEICAKGPQVMAGYWKNTKATQKTIVNDWLKTGDLGKTDKSGYFYITDRLKDVILVNGYNVYPTQIETALYTLKSVQEALVIGKPDSQKGETPHAYVVLKTGMTESENDILNALKQHLNPLERPSKVHIRTELPKTLIGKPCRKTLREQEAIHRP